MLKNFAHKGLIFFSDIPWTKARAGPHTNFQILNCVSMEYWQNRERRQLYFLSSAHVLKRTIGLLSRWTWQMHLVSVDKFRQTSNIRHTWVGNKIVDHSDVVGASPVGAAPTTSSFSTQHLASMDWPKATAKRDDNHSSFVIWCGLY